VEDARATMALYRREKDAFEREHLKSYTEDSITSALASSLLLLLLFLVTLLPVVGNHPLPIELFCISRYLKVCNSLLSDFKCIETSIIYL
jgi:hypothetical protein